MTNYSIFNHANAPLYTNMTNTYANPGVETLPEGNAAISSLLFTLTTGGVSVSSGQSLLLQAANPAGSGKTLYLSKVMGGTTAAATLLFYSGGTITGGTTPVPVNSNFGSSNASIITSKQNTGSLTGTPTTVITLPITAGMYLVALGGAFVIPAGQTFTATLGTGALTGSINIIWWEY
ncbi:hypothetical protein [Paenibacillus radicis (ex Xue et al. 2023)]|uniref:BclA C-terminal domain-containing protein n=1 Tax=Paenibacillus radicis (ex Xue et al. 2023) TaxID=2972489 RepID=A0ABT1YCT6_9BACL|nr:hypothetical protein [Paenibacillus radicis (ex Xue et al. 2023)]MCR8631014.1 hypothetical protein [Paenibacillus radicis (ex Xue et al. 2023)]